MDYSNMTEEELVALLPFWLLQHPLNSVIMKPIVKDEEEKSDERD